MLSLLVWISLLSVVFSLDSSALYAISRNKLYLTLSNDDLVSIDYSITGDIPVQDETIKTLQSPAAGSSLFLVNDELYSMGSDDDGNMALSKYNDDDDNWHTIDLDADDVSDKTYYNQSSYLNAADENQIYIYGGIKDDDEASITSRMVSLDFDSFKLSNITTSTRPQPFYGSANLLAPDATNQLLIGGKSKDGWLNMNQLATWNFASGWSFQTISNGTDISSRKNALVLPIFSKMDANSVQDVAKDYTVSKVLVLGGETDKGQAKPVSVYLDVAQNDWAYQTPENSLNLTGVLGVVTVFDNIITIKASSKRDSAYGLHFYDLNFNEMEKFQVPASHESSSSDYKKSVQQKAILGTVLPLCALLAFAGVGYVVMKKRKEKKLKQELNDLNYHFENDYKVDIGHHNFDSNSTLDVSSAVDVNSIDSWVKKRQQYKNAFLHSQDTLAEEHEVISSPEPSKPFTKLNKHVVRLRNSMSFGHLPSPERKNLLDDEASIENASPEVSPRRNPQRPKQPTLKSKGSLIGLGLEMSPVKKLQSNSHPMNVNINERPPEMYADDEYDSDTSLDNFDVQVLVSSKRRSTLKVVNPDVESNRSNSVREKNLRYRIPSADTDVD